jgi:transposase
MGKPASMDLRERVVAAVEVEGLSRNQAAARYDVAVSSAVRWVALYRSTGSVAPGKMGGHKPKALRDEHAEWLIQRCRERAFTISQLVEELVVERGLKVDRHSVWAFLHAEGLSFKKSVLAEEQERPDVARRRGQWRKYQGSVKAGRLVFIDETWAKTTMTPLRGWCARGERLRAKAPFGHWKTMTFIAALRCDRIDAPCLFDGPINGELFLAYVRGCLVPTLQPGDIVIMDNLGSHRGKAVRKAIREAGARLLFLPKYSPDLNPIEQVFAKLKHLLRKARARSYDGLLQATAELLDTFLPNECAAYLRNSGYAA